MIEVQNLTKKYRDLTAVNNISFKVSKGEILGFLGPNGAGKTTTMRMITGFLSPSSGQTSVNGVSVFDDPLTVKRQIGYLPETPPLYIDMTVKDYLAHVSHLKGLKHREIDGEIHRVTELCGLEPVFYRLIRNLSKGYRQRVGIAQALLGNPKVLILDEPTSGLDPAQIREVRSLIQNLAKDHTVILSTHILPEVRMICSRVIVIHRGTMVANDTIDNLSKRFEGSARLAITFTKEPKGALEMLLKLKEVELAHALDEGHKIEVQLADESEEAQARILEKLVNKGYKISRFENVSPTLEDIFLRIVGGDESALLDSAEDSEEAEAAAETAADESNDTTDSKDEESGDKDSKDKSDD